MALTFSIPLPLRMYSPAFQAHDEHGVCNTGDEVRIKICRPHSKTKTWTVDEVLRKNPAVVYQQRKAAEEVAKTAGGTA